MHRRHHSASVRIAAGCAAALWLLSISGCTRQGPEDQQSIAGASGTVAGAGTGGQSGSRGAAAAPVQGGAGAGAGAAAAPSTAGAGAGGGGAGASGGGAGASGSAQEADAATPPEDAGPTVSPFPPAGDLVAAGPYTSTTVSNSGPNGNYTIYHPAELAPGGARNPIVGWMSGGSTNPALYTLLPHLASHGFVVVASNTVPAIGEEIALGQEIIAGIDWILEQNGNASSPFFEKLDATKVASMGYSMGALATTTIADDPRLTTTVHISGGNMVTERIAKLHAPAAFFCGENDIADPNCATDFAAATTPVFYGVFKEGDHLGVLLPPYDERIRKVVTGWLRWQLMSDGALEPMFVGSACGVCMDPNWTVQQKNL